MRKSTILTILAVVAFAALLLYNTLSAQKVTCEVCVEFNGHRNCATASHENEDEAAQSAQRTACGTLANGMNETIACGNKEPATRQCRTK